MNNDNQNFPHLFSILLGTVSMEFIFVGLYCSYIFRWGAFATKVTSGKISNNSFNNRTKLQLYGGRIFSDVTKLQLYTVHIEGEFSIIDSTIFFRYYYYY